MWKSDNEVGIWDVKLDTDAEAFTGDAAAASRRQGAPRRRLSGSIPTRLTRFSNKTEHLAFHAFILKP